MLVEFCDWLVKDENSLKPIVDAIHEEGALAGVQIWGFWNDSSSSKNSISQLEQTAVKGGMPHETMTIERIHEFQQEKIALAQLYYKTGFDILELNAGCDHTFDSFLSRFWNVERTDEYGPQSLENRARILTEIIEEVKKTCPGMAVQILYNGVEENVEQLGDSSLCISPEEAVEFGKIFEKAGADSLQVRFGTFGNHAANFLTDIMFVGAPGNTGLGTQVDFTKHYHGMFDGTHGGIGALIEIAANVKNAVSIPVGTVGGMDPRLAPDMVNNAVADGKIDFVVMNRPLVADPYLPAKLQEGKIEEIRPCNHCSTCFQSVVNPNGWGYCRVNAAHTRAYTEEMPEGYEPTMASSPKNVVVVGGGPAGMEAAAVAAKRGHKVTLYEEKDALGGTLGFAAAIKGPHERILDFRDYQIKQLEQAGVDVKTSVKVDASTIKDAAPDVVVLATGILKSDSSIPVSGDKAVLNLEEAAAVKVEGPVCIVGDNLRATDYANFLVEQGISVNLVHEGTKEELAADQAPWPRAVMISLLEGRGVRLNHEASDISVKEDGVHFVSGCGLECVELAQTVVLCNNIAPNAALADELKDICEVVRIGDCDRPSNIMNAVTSGNLVARSI